MNNDRFKFLCWNETSKKYDYFDFGHWCAVTNAKIEQSTGLKDKNGNLIFEGDVFEYLGERFKIVWIYDGFYVENASDFSKPVERLSVWDLHSVEIIGKDKEKQATTCGERVARYMRDNKKL